MHINNPYLYNASYEDFTGRCLRVYTYLKPGSLFCFVGQLDKTTSLDDLDVDQVIALLTQWRLDGLMDEQ